MRTSICIDDAARYPETAPFDPAVSFPELRSLSWAGRVDESNRVYGLVRECLESAGFDEAHAGTDEWSPFRDVITPGDRVVIKPNMVMHHNGASPDISAVVTHASVVRPLVDYALLALEGRGEVIIGDAPQGNTDFDVVIASSRMRELESFYREQGLPVSLRDFRAVTYSTGPTGFFDSVAHEVDHDPDGYTVFDLAHGSFVESLPRMERLYGADFNRSFIVRNHHPGTHRYRLAGTVVAADVVITVPKMKTHKKTGVTIGLKNSVGIIGDKNYLPHFRIGSPRQGGDEYPEASSVFERVIRVWDGWARDHLLAQNTSRGRRVNHAVERIISLVRRADYRFRRRPLVYGGNWFANDTTWRMALDLNLLLRYAGRDGKVHAEPQRRVVCVVDGIVAGEGDGPMEPTPRPVGLIASGTSPVQIDSACAAVMGFDPGRLPLLVNAMADPRLAPSPEERRVSCRVNGTERPLADIDLSFEPHLEWVGHVERQATKPAAAE